MPPPPVDPQNASPGTRLAVRPQPGEVSGRPAGPVVPCAGAVVFDGAGRLLLVRRGRPPGEGLWSVPGGRLEPGETVEQAVAREMREETGLEVDVGRLLGTVSRPGPGDVTYEIADYIATVCDGQLHAGDDAAEAEWFGPAALVEAPLVPGLLETLRSWHAIE